jgi:protein gp37
LFHLIENGKYNNLVFLFLTKRPENIDLFIPQNWKTDSPKNVWFGASISNQETADNFTNILNCYKANNLFLSVEPQVDFIELNHKISTFSWIIQGGESGHNKREFNIEWARSLRNECQDAKIPYFFKQIDKIQEIPRDLQIREFPNF